MVSELPFGRNCAPAESRGPGSVLAMMDPQWSLPLGHTFTQRICWSCHQPRTPPESEGPPPAQSLPVSRRPPASTPPCGALVTHRCPDLSGPYSVPDALFPTLNLGSLSVLQTLSQLRGQTRIVPSPEAPETRASIVHSGDSQAPALNEGRGWRGRVCTITAKGLLSSSLLITHRLTRLLSTRLQNLVLINRFQILITSLQPSTWHVGILQNFPKHPASRGPHEAWRLAPLGATGPPAHHSFMRGSLCS